MPVAATRQVRSLPAVHAGGPTDRPYPLIGGLLDHEPFGIRQAVCPVDKLVDLLLENLRRSGGAALGEREKLTNAFCQRTMNIVGLVVLRYRKSAKLRRDRCAGNRRADGHRRRRSGSRGRSAGC